MTIELEKTYKISGNVIARKIEGELVIIPIRSGIGDLEAEMYSLSKTGIAVWDKLDGERTLEELIRSLMNEYNAPYEEIKSDVVELVESLFEKGLVFEH